MYHPLYYQSRGWVGRTVLVHHRNGRVYRGTLLGVEPHGVYVMEQRIRPSFATHDVGTDVDTDLCSHYHVDADLVYAPASYFAFGALTGLTLGAMAGGLYW